MRRQAQPALHQRHELGRQRFVLREQAVGPARHFAPVGELAELQPAQRHRAARQHRLEFDCGEVALLEAQPAHAAPHRDLGREGRCLGRNQRVAVPLPLHRPRLGRVQRHAPNLHRHRPLPRHALRVAPAENRVRARYRILQLQRVADAHVAEQHAGGDHAAVDALLQAGLALQEAHLRGGGVVDDLLAAQDRDPVQHQLLVLRNELHRNLADLAERARIEDLLRDVDQDHRLVADQQVRVVEPHRERAARRHGRRDRQHIGPGRQRRAAHERTRGDRDLFQRGLGRCGRVGGGRRHRDLSKRLGRGAQRQQTRATPNNAPNRKADQMQGRLGWQQRCSD